MRVPSTSSASATVFSLFASAAVFSFFACASASSFSAWRYCFFCDDGFSFDFFDDLLVSFFELKLLNFIFFSVLFLPSYFIISCFPLKSCHDYSFQTCDRENCHYTSVVTSHVNHVVDFDAFMTSQVSSLG